jgi:hypothetical protein
MIETILKMNEAMGYCDNIGCVYPTDGESYYINSNVQVKLEAIECSDGYFFGRVINDELRNIRQVESFYSPSLEALYHQIALRNKDKDEFEEFEPYEE